MSHVKDTDGFWGFALLNTRHWVFFCTAPDLRRQFNFGDERGSQAYAAECNTVL
jgi:hypothetical protein